MARSEGRPDEGSPRTAAAGGSTNTTQDCSDNADDSSSVGESGMCRICFRGPRAGVLLSPCNCRGTIGLVHRECLEEWLSRRNTDECNICSYQFKVERTPKSIMDWLRDPSSQANRWYILMDMSLSLFGAIMLLVSAWMSALEIITGMSSVLGCLLIGIVVVLAGLICAADIYLMVRHHHQALIQWRQSNWGVRLLLPSSAHEGTASADLRAPQPEQLPPPPPSEPLISVPPSPNTTTVAADNNATPTTTVTQQGYRAVGHTVA